MGNSKVPAGVFRAFWGFSKFSKNSVCSFYSPFGLIFERCNTSPSLFLTGFQNEGEKIVTPFPTSTTVNDTIFYNLVGNFIPPEWRNLTSIDGKVLSKTARQILSLIVSRLQNDKILEGANDELNELQESYYYFEQLLGVCQRRIRQCLLELCDGGFIQLTLNTVIKNYVKCSKVREFKYCRWF